ncbi:Gfo/Idh/MocA family oxidoreductase [Microlunatus elymi]|uniref:Gfo/Idh/MocA family oxidoreductase n=1 Tax=Microlunatus elymi TaxID=2596828 RepID=A0A516PW70_9ACTN|nr:Gfo/Idh/MocA family oxidoreductase [Microlunatus elymi]QDP95382.1 Gfo/Idh/MocA family oxidoreductase [Microlunatus elymi]
MSAASPRVAVIGAGGIGRVHLNAYQQAGADLVAVADLDAAAAEAAAASYDITGFDNAGTMLDQIRPDLVSICTPPARHAELAIEALTAGVAVLCEKPMACTVAECAAIEAAAYESGSLLSVGFCHRFQPEIEAMRAAIRSGRIGTVLTYRNVFEGPLDGVEARWFSQTELSGGGVLMDTCVHSVDLFRFLIGEIDQVRAITATTASDRGPALAVEDSAQLTLRSTTGVLGAIEASWRVAPGEATVTVCGSQGRLQLDYSTLTLTQTDPDGNGSALEVITGDRFVRQARHVLECVAEGRQPQVTGADGARAIAVLSDAYASATDSVISKEK